MAYYLRPRPRRLPAPGAAIGQQGRQTFQATPATPAAPAVPTATPTQDELDELQQPDAVAPLPYSGSARGQAMAGNVAPLVRQQAEQSAALAAVDQIGTRPQPVAMPGGGGNGLRQALAGVGQAVKDNPLGVVNGALGVAGLIENATAKQPAVPAYQDFQPTVAPATGMNAGVKQQLLNRIASNQLAAGRPVTVDPNLLMATRLQAAQNAGEQQLQVEQQDQQLLQQNQERNQQVLNDAGRLNSEGRNNQRKAVFDVANQRAQTQKAQGTAMAQSALTYFAQADAARRQQAQADVQRGNDQKRARYMTLQTLLNSGTLSAEQRASYTSELAALEAEAGGSQAPITSMKTSTTAASTTPLRRRGGLVPRFRRGGQLGGSQTQETSITIGPGAGASVGADMLREFKRSMDRVTEQATQNMAQVLRDALHIRSRPLR